MMPKWYLFLFIALFLCLVFYRAFSNHLESHNLYKYFFFAARKRFIESKLQSLDPQFFGIDSYLKVLESAKEKRDVQKRSTYARPHL
jgi:hypothetical protein